MPDDILDAGLFFWPSLLVFLWFLRVKQRIYWSAFSHDSAGPQPLHFHRCLFQALWWSSRRAPVDGGQDTAQQHPNCGHRYRIASHFVQLPVLNQARMVGSRAQTLDAHIMNLLVLCRTFQKNGMNLKLWISINHKSIINYGVHSLKTRIMSESESESES